MSELYGHRKPAYRWWRWSLTLAKGLHRVPHGPAQSPRLPHHPLPSELMQSGEVQATGVSNPRPLIVEAGSTHHGLQLRFEEVFESLIDNYSHLRCSESRYILFAYGIIITYPLHVLRENVLVISDLSKAMRDPYGNVSQKMPEMPPNLGAVDEVSTEVRDELRVCRIFCEVKHRRVVDGRYVVIARCNGGTQSGGVNVGDAPQLALEDWSEDLGSEGYTWTLMSHEFFAKLI